MDPTAPTKLRGLLQGLLQGSYTVCTWGATLFVLASPQAHIPFPGSVACSHTHRSTMLLFNVVHMEDPSTQACLLKSIDSGNRADPSMQCRIRSAMLFSTP